MAALTITAGNVLLVTGRQLTGTALTTITAGQALYTDLTRGQYGANVGPSDANGTANLRTTIGISLHAALAGQPILYAGTDGDVVSFGAILTQNLCYIAGGGTPGDINPIADLTSGWYLSTCGFAMTTSNLRVTLLASGVAS